MSRRDLLLGLLVPFIWGLNFVVIQVGLDSIPPLLLAALRFGVAGFVGIWFVPRPAGRWGTVVAVGLAIGVGQFGVLFVAIDRGMPAGLAGVVVQVQVLFTIALAFAILGEQPSPLQLTGLAIAVSGLVLLAIDATDRLVFDGFVLTMIAGLSWAVGNLQLRRLDSGEALGVVVWSSLIPPLPLVVLVALLDSPAALASAVDRITVVGLLTVGYQALFATLLAFGIWVRLLATYETATVTPLALLVPVVALVSATLILGEQLTVTAAVGAILLTLGLAIPYGRATVAIRWSPR